ncbi:MAG: inositol monophosphatase [Alphaproteobacteria bacterium]|nr:inositol monophosphatase [Alphaproteobacteria bacterium]
MTDDLMERLDLAKNLAREAGELGMTYFRSIGELVIEQKGTQDLVSNADREVELFIRGRLSDAFPNDGIVGEEHDDVTGSSGFVWVIDPIDGTANFVRSIPAWCVAIACVHQDQTKIGAIYEPCHDELFSCALGNGAFLNDARMHVATTNGLDDGNTGVGINGRTNGQLVTRFIELLVDHGGLFYRNASGALMLAYVASGRLIGYSEPHMNAWDCLAGQLLIAEAGGMVERQSADDMLVHGGRVVAGAPAIFETLVEMSDEAFAE